MSFELSAMSYYFWSLVAGYWLLVAGRWK